MKCYRIELQKSTETTSFYRWILAEDLHKAIFRIASLLGPRSAWIKVTGIQEVGEVL